MVRIIILLLLLTSCSIQREVDRTTTVRTIDTTITIPTERLTDTIRLSSIIECDSLFRPIYKTTTIYRTQSGNMSVDITGQGEYLYLASQFDSLQKTIKMTEVTENVSKSFSGGLDLMQIVYLIAALIVLVLVLLVVYLKVR